MQHRNPFDWTHDALNGAPQGVPRVPATLLASGALQTAFVWGLGGLIGLVGAWNAFMVLGLVGTSMAMFALLDWLGCTFAACLLGGFVFGFSPYALERAYSGQLALLENWVLVLVVAGMLWLRARRSVSAAVGVGATIALAFYMSAYAGLLAAVVAFTFFLVELARLPANRERVRSVALAGVASTVSVAALTPVLVLYARERALGPCDLLARHERSVHVRRPDPRVPPSVAT